VVFQLDPRPVAGLRVRGAERTLARASAPRRQRKGALARAFSLVVALALTVTLTIAPFAFVREMTASAHAGVSLLLLGVCLCFAHGVGFSQGRVVSVLFSPAVAWGSVILGAASLLFA
jgi:predicted membrane protein